MNPPYYTIQELLTGAKKLLSLVNNTFYGHSVDVNQALAKVNNSLQKLDNDSLQHAILDYQLTIEYLLHSEDDNWEEHPDLDNY